MAGTATVQSAPMTSMQGIAIPAQSVNPEAFKALTRRHTQQEGTKAYSSAAAPAGDVFLLRKSDILAGITIRFTGQMVVTGTVSTTARWPYDFLKAVRFTANGASNLINVSGLKLKIRDVMKNDDLTDRGVTQTVAGVSRTQGTLARATETWGVGSATAGVAAGTYPIELEWFVPVAEDMKDLTGAIFLATSSSDLTLSLDYETPANLWSTTGTVALTGTVAVTSHKFSIPVGGDGQIVVPNLNAFHSLIQSSYTALGTGENEIPIVGQGAGKALLRLFYQHYNGAGTASAPLAMTAANFGVQAWRYATNETPDQWIDGSQMRHALERNYNADIGGIWGVGCHEFAAQNTFRDVVDLGTTSELRLVSNIMSSVTLANPRVEYVMETVYGAGQA
jgi:hypothetical protein